MLTPKTFDNFNFNRVHLKHTGADWNQFVQAVQKGQKYRFQEKILQKEAVTEFVSSRYSRLILWGLQGRGKSHLAKALLNQHEDRNSIENPGSKYYKWYSWELDKEGILFTDCISAQELYDIFFKQQPHIDCDLQQKANNDYRYIFKAQVLLIDDIGSEKETEKEVFPQGFLKFLDNYLVGKLIVTTNLSPVSILARYKEKIFSRLFENAMVICVTGNDYRLSKTNEVIK